MAVDDEFVPWPDDVAQRYVDRGYWVGRSIGDLLWAVAESCPGSTAVVDAERRLTYADLCSEADAMADTLESLGLCAGDTIVLQLPNCVDFVVVLLACLRSGIVPVMALPAHRALELRHMVEIAGASALIVADEIRGFDHQALALDLMAQCPSVESVLVIGRARDPAIDLRAAAGGVAASGRRSPWDDRAPQSRSIALFLLSGGTTGMPKLIPRTHDDYAYNARASAKLCRLSAESVYLVVLPASHNFPLACPGILGTLLNGGRVVMLPSPEPERAFKTIAAEGVTVTAVVPAIAQRWMDSAASSTDDLSSLRLIQVGGARITDEVARQVAPKLGAQLQQVFGMAEGLLNYTRLDDSTDVTCTTQGRPLSPDDEVRVVDVEDQEVPPGQAGILLTRGPYTPRGYYRAREQNERSYASGGWYRTGDIVRVTPGGNFVVEGREKDIINRGGEKISAEDVENLAYGIGEIAFAAAVGMEDPELGERVCLYVVLRDPNKGLTLDMVRSRMESAGVSKHAWPERLEVVAELPTTKVGKIDKKALRDDVAARLAAGGAAAR